MKSRQDIIQQLNQAEQSRGNLTVLFTNSISEKIGLSATEFECLDIIGDRHPITAGQLASITGLSTGGITGVVDRLEQAGYVKRQRDTVDRRRVLLEQVVDAQTVKKIQTLYQPLSQKFDEMCREFTKDELAIVLKYEHMAVKTIRDLLQTDSQ